MTEERIDRLREKGEVLRRRLDAAEVINLIMQYHDDILLPEVHKFLRIYEDEKKQKVWWRRVLRKIKGWWNSLDLTSDFPQ